MIGWRTVIEWDPLEILAGVRVAWTEATALTVAAARMNAPVATGDLARSIGAVPVGSLHSVLAAGVPYAAAVESGSRPHEIVPSVKQALAGPGFGPVERVEHPGTQGQHFMARAADGFGTVLEAVLMKP